MVHLLELDNDKSALGSSNNETSVASNKGMPNCKIILDLYTYRVTRPDFLVASRIAIRCDYTGLFHKTSLIAIIMCVFREMHKALAVV